jgi:iodotyrosine deiodinase
MESPKTIAYTPEPVPVEEAVARGAAFLDLLEGRRSVRHFSEEPVPRQLIETAIRCAGTAPSGANLQPWTFVAISDPLLKREIRRAAEEEEKLNYESRMGEVWLDSLKHLGTTWEKPMLEQAPWLIAVFKQTTRPDGRPNYYVQESVGLAVGLLLAALRTMGLCSLTHTPSPMAFLSQILERPANERPFLLIPVGYAVPDCRVPDQERKPLSGILVLREPVTQP